MIEFNFDKNDGEGDSNEDKLPSLDKDESKCSSQSRTEGKNTFFIAMATPNIFQLLRRITTNYTRYNQLSTLWWKNARRYLKRSTTLWMSKLIDHTREHIEKSLSPAQPDQLLMNPEKKIHQDNGGFNLQHDRLLNITWRWNSN